jgi:hypothetical protein
MRQKTELEITLQAGAAGEARSAGMEGTEARTAGIQMLLNPSNRRIRSRTYGGVGGEEPKGSPYPDRNDALN